MKKKIDSLLDRFIDRKGLLEEGKLDALKNRALVVITFSTLIISLIYAVSDMIDGNYAHILPLGFAFASMVIVLFLLGSSLPRRSIYSFFMITFTLFMLITPHIKANYLI